MDIQDALWKLRNEMSAEQAHIAGEANQFDAVRLQQINNLRVEFGPVDAFRFDRGAREPKLAGTRETGRSGAI